MKKPPEGSYPNVLDILSILAHNSFRVARIDLTGLVTRSYASDSLTGEFTRSGLSKRSAFALPHY